MKKLSYFLFSVALVALVSCGKDGEQGPAGPAGPAGATGPAGPPAADYAVYNDTIPVASWVNGYTEFERDYITQEAFENGIITVMVEDDFGYYNSVPSDYHPITGYGYAFDTATNIGVIGFESQAAVTEDRNVKVAVMTMRAYQELVEQGIENDIIASEAYFANKK